VSYYYGTFLRGGEAVSGGGGGGGGGGGAGLVALESDTYGYSTISPTTATASVSAKSTGLLESSSGYEYDWLLSGAAADYEIRATIVSGSVTSGTTGAWLALSSTRTWTRTRTTLGTSTVTMTLEIRRVSDGLVLDTATVALEATVDL
jgi:hypothetical protein